MRTAIASVLVGALLTAIAGCGEPSPPKPDDPEVVRPKLELPARVRDNAPPAKGSP